MWVLAVVGILVGIFVLIWTMIGLARIRAVERIAALLIYTLPFTVPAFVVLFAGWQLSDWMSTFNRVGAEAVRIGSVAVVGWLAYRTTLLKVPVRRRSARRRLRAAGTIGEHEDVQAVVRGRVQRQYGPRDPAVHGTVRELCPAGDRLQRIDLVLTASQVVLITRHAWSRRSARSVRRHLVVGIYLQQEGISLYRAFRGTAGDVDDLRAPRFGSDEFVLALPSRSGLFLVGGPPYEVDQLRRVMPRQPAG